MSNLIKVLARIEYLATSKGRQGPFISGYRPIFTFVNARTKISGRIGLINKESFAQGETGLVELSFIKGVIDDSHFTVGKKFTFAEEPNVIGEGEIIEQINS
jgi:hypothetical protein